MLGNPLRSTQARLALLLGFLAISSLAGLWALEHSQRGQFDQLVRAREAEINPRFDRLLDLSGRSLQTFAFDYSYWDEMVSMAHERSEAWGDENIAAALPTYHANAGWVFDLDFRCIYHADTFDSTDVDHVPVPLDQLAASLGENWFCHFFARGLGDQVFEYRGAPIQPSSDGARSSPPQGWFLVARLWDEAVLRDLAELTQSRVEILASPPEEPIVHSQHLGEGTFALERPLVGLSGQKLAKLRFSVEFAGLGALARDGRNLLGLGAAALLFVLAITLLFVRSEVMRPLQSIARSLARQDPEPIRGLARSETELGRAASTILRSYQRRDELLHEIEARIRIETELRAAKDAAESGQRAQSEFLANVSHELRTPMNAIIGLTEVTLDSDLDANQREQLEIVRDSAESLLELLNQILDFSKIESGHFSLDPEPFELRARIVGDLRAMALRAEQKGLSFAIEIDEELPEVVVGDPDRLRQVFVNLIGNAVKFTDRGRVRVEVHKNADSTDELLSVHFAVRDDGIGIPTEKARVIFEPFTQADGSTTRRYGGTGLGLTISERIVTKMNGEIWCESQIGRGSVFHFTARFPIHPERASLAA